jgi:hypothetical protein
VTCMLHAELLVHVAVTRRVIAKCSAFSETDEYWLAMFKLHLAITFHTKTGKKDFDASFTLRLTRFCFSHLFFVCVFRTMRAGPFPLLFFLRYSAETVDMQIRVHF